MAYTITERCIGCGACMRICPVTAISGQPRGRHGIDAGICVECGACGRVCPASAIEDPSGSTCVRARRETWPRPAVEQRSCVSCTACIQACPVGCLTLDRPDPRDHNAGPVLSSPDRCIACGFCRDACPVGAVTMA